MPESDSIKEFKVRLDLRRFTGDPKRRISLCGTLDGSPSFSHIDEVNPVLSQYTVVADPSATRILPDIKLSLPL